MERLQIDQILKRIDDVNSNVGDENRLLHAAVVDGDPEGVQYLLELGADPQIPGELGLTALDLAHHLGLDTLTPLLGGSEAQAVKIILKGCKKFQELPTHKAARTLNFQYRQFHRYGDYSELKTVYDLCAQTREKGYMHTERIYLGMTYRKELNSGESAPISVRWISDELGYGLFSETDLPRWSWVGVYTGLVERRRWLGSGMGDYSFRYPIGELYPKRYVVNSEKEGNLMRFLNHSDDPNCTTNACFYKGLMHLLVYTHRNVKAGEQLCFDYGAHYWGRKAYVSMP